MSPQLSKLVAVGGAALCSGEPSLREPVRSLVGRVLQELTTLLTAKNGFYVFESALHVYCACSCGNCIDINALNGISPWRDKFGDILNGFVFFAADIFGCQFCLSEAGVHRFDPETAAISFVGVSLEDWAGIVLDNINVETGYAVAHEWQAAHGPLPIGKRLVPITPFFMGGTFTLDNLMAIDETEAMSLRADVYTQTRDLPDGTTVRFTVSD